MKISNGLEDFQSRLRWIIGARKPYPWAERIGSNRGTVNRMLQGKIPGYETLGAISHAEGCGLNWLLFGEGVPFPVQRWDSDAECAVHLDGVLTDKPDAWTIYVVEGSETGALCLVLTRPGRHRYSGKRVVDYTVVEVHAGRLAGRTLHRVRAALGENDILRVYASREPFARLAGGQVGTWELVGDEHHPGLLAHGVEAKADTLDKLSDTLPQVAETPPPAYGSSDLLCANLRRLSEEKRQVIKTTVVTFLDSEGKAWQES